jgi:hypothetical protein
MMIIERQAIRAILLTQEQEILLLRIRSPEGGEWFWISIGGISGHSPGSSLNVASGLLCFRSLGQEAESF